MGKLPTSLLSVVFQLCLIDTILADEQVRRVQEEFRKRHLFYGDTSGEISPALISAISRYQQQKGFRRTGRLDSEIFLSLGVLKAPPTPPSSTPYCVVAGDVRDANGEPLPNFMVAYRSSDQPETEPASATNEAQRIAALTSAGDDAAVSIKSKFRLNSRSHARSRRAPLHKETNPFVLAFHTVDHALKLIVSDTQPKTKRVLAKRTL
ncbi:MAG TPA: peptidoglycan-binding domain-containing protein [Chthoniobacterales bacterium]|nr:peptidoglycan-binding domain-containing protein [Chthoniobacterales bacterium]